jgi:hypothetical protein
MILPGMLSRRAGSQAAFCIDHFVCCSSATSNSATSFAAFATATDWLPGVKATAVTAVPSCRHEDLVGSNFALSTCKGQLCSPFESIGAQ